MYDKKKVHENKMKSELYELEKKFKDTSKAKNNLNDEVRRLENEQMNEMKENY